MDRQNRVGSKFGGGGISSSAQTERERKERLKLLALETIDLQKDPYLIQNSIGLYECKLCCTIHRDESNYLSHTQGKKHQHALARRAFQEQQQQKQQQQDLLTSQSVVPTSMKSSTANTTTTTSFIKIGRPAYQVYKSRDPITNQRCLSFEIDYSEIDSTITQPRYRFMSCYEQKIDLPPNPLYQYIIFAAIPYTTIAFKIPNEPIRHPTTTTSSSTTIHHDDSIISNWDIHTKKFTVTFYYL